MASNLSAKLYKIFKNSGYTQKGFADQFGVDRSYLNRILNGSLMPNIDWLTSFCSKLALDDPTKDELFDIYEREADGDSLYNQRRSMVSLIENIARVNNIEQISTLGASTVELGNTLLESHVRHFESQLQIFHLITTLIRSQSNGDEHCIINMHTPVWEAYQELLSQIFSIAFAERRDIEIRHISAIESCSGISSEINTRIFAALIPCSITACDIYKAYYYKGTNVSHINDVFPHPYYMLINDYLILLSRECDSAVLIDDRDTVEHYRSSFELSLRSAQPVSIGNVDLIQALTLYDNRDNRRLTSQVTLAAYAPLCLVYNGDDLAALRNPELNSMENIDLIVERFKRRFNDLHNGGTSYATVYLSTSGLETFAREGYSDEVPRGLMLPIPPSDRKRYFKKVNDLIVTGKKIYILRNDRIRLAPSFGMQYVPNKLLSITINNVRTKGQSFALISEESLISAFNDLINYLPTSRLVMEKWESAGFVNNLINEIPRE